MNRLLSLLNKNELSLVTTSTFNKGETIFSENEICNEISIVLDGVIEISTYSFNDTPIIFNRIFPNQVFGNNLLFSSSPKYRGNVICKTKAKIAFIQKEDLVNIISNNKMFLIEYLKIQSDFGKTLNYRIKLLSFNNAEDRLLFYLKEKNNVIIINSISYLARELSLTREATSRLVKRMNEDNKIFKEDFNNKIMIRLADDKGGKV